LSYSGETAKPLVKRHLRGIGDQRASRLVMVGHGLATAYDVLPGQWHWMHGVWRLR